MTARFRSAILCYHAVSDGWPHGLSVGADQFERQVRVFLRRGYRGASVGEAVDGSRRLLHATFDDAYVSVVPAVATLERLGVGATVFACTGFADEGRPLDIPELAGEASRYPEALRTLDWDALRDLADRGVEIGAHTVTHAHLPALSDAALDGELADSKAAIEDHLLRPCRYVAYPFGEEDSRVRRAAGRAGYDAGFGLPGQRDPIDRYSVPRIGLYRKDNVVRTLAKSMPLARRLAAGGA